MAQKNINARIKNKRDTSANWDKNNPVLLNGEIIIVDMPTGEVRYKTGDGVKTYKQLPFDDEAIKAQITQLQNSIPDVSKYVTAGPVESIVEDSTPTFAGHPIGDFMLKSGGNLTGRLIAQSNNEYTTAQVRNIIISTANPSGGNNGDIWIKYQ